MGFRRLLAAALAAAFLAVPVAPTRAQAPPAPAAHSVDVTRATLPNGLQVVVLRDTLAPVVATFMNYLTGTDEEAITGTAHAQEHMLFRGSKTLTASQFADTMSITGGTFDASTFAEMTQYFFEMPSQYLDVALNLERSRAGGVLDSQKLWDQERGAITQEVTLDNSSATNRLFFKSIQHVFAGTPYANFGLGTVQSFKQIQAKDLKAYYARWYHPNNAIFVIAGNVDPQATIGKVKALFGNVPAAKLPARRPVHLQPLTPLTLHDNSSAPVTLGFVAYRVPGYEDKDYFAWQILNDVLKSQRGALYELKTSGKALNTFAQAVIYPKAGMTLIGASVPVTTTGETAIANVKAVIEAYKKSGLPADLVEVAKQRKVAQAQFARNSIFGLATAWSQTLGVEHRTPDEDLAGVEAVTVDDVNRVLRTYYDQNTATVAISTPKEAAGPAFGGKQDEDITFIPTEHTGLPSFAKRILSNLRVPESTVKPVMQTLPNGLKLVVVPSSISPTAIVRGEVLNDPGVQEPAGKEGLAQIVDGLFPYGTQTYDRTAFQTELDKIATSVNAGRKFGTDVQSKNFDRGVELLADDELHPAFPAQAFDIVKQQTVGSLTGRVKSPEYKAGVATANALYPAGDPARRSATPESAGTVTLDDVKAYYAATFRPDLTTIVVVGDVTPEHARAAVDKSFGAWKADGPRPNVFPPPVPPNKAASVTIPATGRVQSAVRMSETISLTYADPDYAVLLLANEVLSDGFSSLLYHDLRELHGYVYDVGTELSPGRNRSVFSVTYGSDPENVARAARLVVDDVTSLQRKPLAADRLTRAKALALGEVPIGRESYDGLAGELLSYAQTDRPLDEDRIEATAQLAATPDRVRAVMAKWIRPNDFVRVVVAPVAK
jgi:zinc protease